MLNNLLILLDFRKNSDFGANARAIDRFAHPSEVGETENEQVVQTFPPSLSCPAGGRDNDHQCLKQEGQR